MPSIQNPPPSIRGKVLLNFGLFFIFFFFYLFAAVLQTPTFKDLAELPVFGMPLGFLLSLMIFPLSWVIMIIWFWRSK
jgi:hypothetical protein